MCVDEDISCLCAQWHFNSVLASDERVRDALSDELTAFRQKKSEFTCLVKLNSCVSSTLCVAQDIHKRSGDWYCEARKKNKIKWVSPKEIEDTLKFST